MSFEFYTDCTYFAHLLLVVSGVVSRSASMSASCLLSLSLYVFFIMNFNVTAPPAAAGSSGGREAWGYIYSIYAVFPGYISTSGISYFPPPHGGAAAELELAGAGGGVTCTTAIEVLVLFLLLLVLRFP